MNQDVTQLEEEVSRLRSELKVKADALMSTEKDLQQLRADNESLKRVNGELAITTTSTLRCMTEYKKLTAAGVKNGTISVQDLPELETFRLSPFARDLCKSAQMHKVVVREAPRYPSRRN